MKLLLSGDNNSEMISHEKNRRCYYLLQDMDFARFKIFMNVIGETEYLMKNYFVIYFILDTFATLNFR